MSEENVDTLREMVATWNRGDLDAVLEHFHPDCEVAFRPEVPEPGPFRGREEFRAWAEGFLQAWGETHTEVREIVARGPDWLLAEYHLTAQGTGSGLATELTWFNLFEFDSGKILRWRDFTERADALEAAGLSE